jgi:hypothetical protein
VFVIILRRYDRPRIVAEEGAEPGPDPEQLPLQIGELLRGIP